MFRGVGRIETEKVVYSLVLGIGDTTLEPNEKPPFKEFPGSDFFNAVDISFWLPGSNPTGITDTPEYNALPAILDFYAANEHTLRWSQAIQKAENAARQRWRENHPEIPKDTVFEFWLIKPSAKSISQ